MRPKPFSSEKYISSKPFIGGTGKLSATDSSETVILQIEVKKGWVC
jgi:hypothetical protein